METNGIDLKKCKGWYFKAKIHETHCEGRIQVERDTVFLCQDSINGAECQDTLGFKYSWGIIDGSKVALKTNNVTDFEIIPRDPETYKEWQVGDSLLNEDISSSGELPDGRVIFRSGEFVVIADWQGNASPYTCDELYGEGYRLVLTDIEKQIIEARKKAEWKPQDGDICFVTSKTGDWCFVFIFRSGRHRTNFYISICRKTGRLATNNYALPDEDIAELRPATDEEKQMLFDALEKKGKRWNAEKKVVEDIPKPYEFKKGEPVLVRDNGCVWKIGVFTKMRADYFQYGAMTNGLDECGYHFCIPYNERTMHLLGTSRDYEEER